MIDIDKSAKISVLADLESSSRGSSLIIGPKSQIDAFVKIKFAGGNGDIKIEDNVYINSGCVIYSGNGVFIGSNTLIAANCTLAATNHQYKLRDELIKNQGFKSSKGGIIIEDDCWIGCNSVILDGAHIGKGAVIAAGSIIRGIVKPYSISVGNGDNVIGSRE